MLWQPGDEIVWREKWHGRTYAALPVRVVLDSREQTAVYLTEGTPFGFDDWPFEGEPDSSWPVPGLPDGWES